MGHILYNYTDICGYLKEQLAGLGVLPRITDTGAKVCIYIERERNNCLLWMK